MGKLMDDQHRESVAKSAPGSGSNRFEERD
jgi:hypothetical protein